MNPRSESVPSYALVLIDAGLRVLRGIYALLKLQPNLDHVLIVSAQSDRPSLDVRLLHQKLQARGVPVTVITARIGKGLIAKMRYCFVLLRQMAIAARSSVMVIDGYSIVASTLSHKPSTRILQMWHGSGAFKKFGHSAIALKNGPNAFLAKVFRMHANYDVVLASGPIPRVHFAEAFSVPIEKVRICPLPHFDELRGNRLAEVRNRVFSARPDLVGNKIALWAPTAHRVGGTRLPAPRLLKAAARRHGYTLIESRVNQGGKQEATGDGEQLTTLDWLAVADVFATDQSSLIFEALYLGIPSAILAHADDVDRFFDTTYFTGADWQHLVVSNPEELFQEKMRSSTAMMTKVMREYVSMPPDGSTTLELVHIIEGLMMCDSPVRDISAKRNFIPFLV